MTTNSAYFINICDAKNKITHPLYEGPFSSKGLAILAAKHIAVTQYREPLTDKNVADLTYLDNTTGRDVNLQIERRFTNEYIFMNNLSI